MFLARRHYKAGEYALARDRLAEVTEQTAGSEQYLRQLAQVNGLPIYFSLIVILV
jgi:hypothetical protein